MGQKSVFLDGSLAGIAVVQKALKQGPCGNTKTGVRAGIGPNASIGIAASTLFQGLLNDSNTHQIPVQINASWPITGHFRKLIP